MQRQYSGNFGGERSNKHDYTKSDESNAVRSQKSSHNDPN